MLCKNNNTYTTRYNVVVFIVRTSRIFQRDTRYNAYGVYTNSCAVFVFSRQRRRESLLQSDVPTDHRIRAGRRGILLARLALRSACPHRRIDNTR